MTEKACKILGAGGSLPEARKLLKRIDIRQLTGVSLEPDPSGAHDKYCCPACGSGHGKGRTGAFSVLNGRNGWRYTCFACTPGTGFAPPGQDSVGALRLLWHCPEREIYYRLNLLPRPGADFDSGNFNTLSAMARQNQGGQGERPDGHFDFTWLIDKWQNALAGHLEPAEGETTEAMEERQKRAAAAMAYLRGRGLSDRAILIFRLGWDEGADAITIPYSARGTYITKRFLHPGDMKYWKPTRAMAGPEPLWYDAGAFYTGDGEPVFIVEGPFDCMAVLQSGYNAFPLCSTANAPRLVEHLKAHQEGLCKRIILLLDDDEAGRKATRYLAKELGGLGLITTIGTLA